MKALLFWLSGFLPCHLIGDEGHPHLERYYLCTAFGVRFYLHRYVGSDQTRGLHDNPWAWAASIVLSGWHWEERRGMEDSEISRTLAALYGTTGLVRKRVRWFNWLTGDSFHRVVLPNILNRKWVDGRYVKNAAQPCWTLFFHRATNTKPWGFLRPMEGHTAAFWVPHNYPKDGTSTQELWWKEVPIGKLEQRRQPCQ
jgi:hypothetical protein